MTLQVMSYVCPYSEKQILRHPPHNLAQQIASKRSIVITGAGISVSSGVPDFRSPDQGLFYQLKAKYPSIVKSGKDFFNYQFWQSETTRGVFNNLICQLKQTSDKAVPSNTHKFLNWVEKNGTLIRCYTQNIDGLEYKARLTKVCQLHGSMETLECMICRHRIDWDESVSETLLSTQEIECDECLSRNLKRKLEGRRELRVGIYRPSIVFYNDPLESGEGVSSQFEADLRQSPAVGMVIGTSLKVCGVIKLVKRLAQVVHSHGGKMVYIDKCDLRTEWKKVFDYALIGDCDNWVEFLGGRSFISESLNGLCSRPSLADLTNKEETEKALNKKQTASKKEPIVPITPVKNRKEKNDGSRVTPIVGRLQKIDIKPADKVKEGKSAKTRIRL